jgi:hypothetical protein
MLSPEDITVSKFKSADEFRDFQCEKTDYSDFVQTREEAEGPATRRQTEGKVGQRRA